MFCNTLYLKIPKSVVFIVIALKALGLGGLLIIIINSCTAQTADLPVVSI